MGWNDKRFVLLVVSQDWKMSVPWEDLITRYFHPEEFCHSFTDINTNAESILHWLGLMQHPTHILNKHNDLRMQRDKFYYSVLLSYDGLVILMWPPDKSVHCANSHSYFSRDIFMTERNLWEIEALEHSPSLISLQTIVSWLWWYSVLLCRLL